MTSGDVNSHIYWIIIIIIIIKHSYYKQKEYVKKRYNMSYFTSTVLLFLLCFYPPDSIDKKNCQIVCSIATFSLSAALDNYYKAVT